jgi:hypothetical protein
MRSNRASPQGRTLFATNATTDFRDCWASASAGFDHRIVKPAQICRLQTLLAGAEGTRVP